MTDYFVNDDGFYVGCSDDAIPPEIGIMVPNPPLDPFGFRWDSQQYVPFITKEIALSKITVTTQSGKTFDGNETARGDIMAAIAAGNLLGKTETNWKMANNEKILVTREELLEALALAIQEKGRIVGAIE